MADEVLKQNELDHLLQKVDDVDMSTANAATPGVQAEEKITVPSISEEQVEIVTHNVQNGLQAGMKKAGGILLKELQFEAPQIQLDSQSALNQEFSKNAIALQQQFSGALHGKLLILLSTTLTHNILQLLRGNTSAHVQKAELSTAELDMLKQTLQPLLAGLTEYLEKQLDAKLSKSELAIYLLGKDASPIIEDSYYCTARTPLYIGNKLHDEKFVLLFSMPFVEQLQVRDQSHLISDSMGIEVTSDASDAQPSMLEVSFPTLTLNIGEKQSVEEPNINLLMDVQMTLTVELGRTKMFIKEILGLGEGSIIELDKLAGEPVDLLVNGKLIAKGEVVVIDENFGVRVTDIVSPAERLRLQTQETTT